MPSGSRLALVALLALLVVGPVAAQPTAPAADRPADGAASHDITAARAAVPDGELLQTNTTMRVQLTGDGDARWTVIARYNLTSQAEIDSFRELGAAFSAGETTESWLVAFQRAQEAASAETGRPMEIRGVDRQWNVTDRNGTTATGRLELTFTWTNFAQVAQDGQRLVVGDVFQTRNGSWLSLVPGQTFILEPPKGYTPVTGGGDLRDQSFYWEGPQSFEDSTPSAVFAGSAGPSTLMMGALVVAGLAVVLLFIYLLASRRETIGDDDGADEPVAGAAASDANGEESDAVGDGPTTGGAGAATADAGAEDEDDEIDVDLLSDEERVERLLERNGGRMKQASIVKETGWSNAKVSQLLSAMAEDDQIDKLRIGRENLISFPDEDVADVDE